MLLVDFLLALRLYKMLVARFSDSRVYGSEVKTYLKLPCLCLCHGAGGLNKLEKLMVENFSMLAKLPIINEALREIFPNVRKELEPGGQT